MTDRRSSRTWSRAVAGATVGASLTLALAASAAAHVTIEPTEGPADGYATLGIQVPHGCDGSATKAVRVKIPKSVPSATPQVHPGWEVTTKEGPKDPVELHGEKVTSGVSEIIWTAREAGPLPDGRLDVFGLSVKLPNGEVGDPVYFPAIQVCEKGETAWIQTPAAPGSEEALESPAPAVVLTAADGGHGDDGSDHAEDEAGAAAAGNSDGDEGPSTGLVIAALALGALGFLTAVAALIGGRRRVA